MNRDNERSIKDILDWDIINRVDNERRKVFNHVKKEIEENTKKGLTCFSILSSDAMFESTNKHLKWLKNHKEVKEILEFDIGDNDITISWKKYQDKHLKELINYV